MHRSIRRLALAALGAALLPVGAGAVPFGFQCITFNDPGDCAIGEAQIEMDVAAGPGAGQVSFTFRNVGPDTSTLARIYFDDGSLSSFDSIINGPGALFIFDPFPGPNDLPGGNDAVPPFMTTLGFLSGAAAPAPSNGIENDLLGTEFVTLVFDLLGGQTVGDVISELSDGTLRAGVHVINFDSGGSESLVSVPEPGTLALLAAAGFALAAARRARRGATSS